MKILTMTSKTHTKCPLLKNHKNNAVFLVETFKVASLGTLTGEAYLEYKKLRVHKHGIVDFNMQSQGFDCPKCKVHFEYWEFCNLRARGYRPEDVKERVRYSSYFFKSVELLKNPLNWLKPKHPRPKFKELFSGILFTNTPKLKLQNDVIMAVQKVSVDADYTMVAKSIEELISGKFFLISVHDFREVMHRRRESYIPVKIERKE